MSLTDRLKALVTYSNEKTGKSDATLSDAVKHLAEGYGGGGDITLGSHKVLFGQFTPTASPTPPSHSGAALQTLCRTTTSAKASSFRTRRL